MNRANSVLVFIITVMISVAAWNLMRVDPTEAAPTQHAQNLASEIEPPSVVGSASGIVYHSKMIVVESLIMTKLAITSAIDSVLGVL